MFAFLSAKAMYWYQVTDFEQFPHVLHFHSWGELLVMLRTLDVKEVSAKMRQFNQDICCELRKPDIWAVGDST